MSNLIEKPMGEIQAEPKESILLEMVKRPDIDPDRLEKFMELQFRMEAKQAEREFNAALAAFQGECPTIDKSKTVDFTAKSGKRTKYDYAPIEEIVSIIRPLLNKHSLSYSFNISETGEKDKILLTTKIRHTSGHCEETTYYFNRYHDDDRMSLSQRAKAAITSAKRTALENALGLTTATEDNDDVGFLTMTDDQLKEIKKRLSDTKSDEAKFLKFLGAESLDLLTADQAKRAIYALKQKGGK